MDEILVKQKVVSCVSEKAKWWEGRRALDSQVEVSVKENLVGRIVQHSQRNLFFGQIYFRGC